MKVVVVDTTLAGDLISGAQTFLPHLLGGLSEQRAEVHLITNGRPNDKIAARIRKSNITVHTHLWSEKLLVEDAAPVLGRWINDLAPQIYVVSLSSDIGWVVLPYLKSSIATISIGHSDDDVFYDPLRHYSYFINKAVGVNAKVCQKFVSQCGLPRESVQWIPYGVEVRDYPPIANYTSKFINLVYVGRLEEKQKRVSDMIRVIKRLEAEQVDYSFKIIGDGASMPIMREALNQEIERGAVEMLGWCGKQEVLEYLQASDAFVLTSEREGLCVSLLEAMGNGCCPIVTDLENGNNQLITNGKNGFVFPTGNVTALARKIKLLNEDRKALAQTRMAAWETGRDYNVSRMVNSYLDCFSKTVITARTKQRKPIPNFPLMESCRSKYPLWMRRIKAKVGIGDLSNYQKD